MSAPLDAALSAVTEAGPEPAANDVARFEQSRIMAIAAMYEDIRYSGTWSPEAAAERIIAADPATAQIADLQAELASKDEALHNMIVLAEPFFTDSTQRLAIDLARQALAAQPVEGGGDA